MRNPELLVYAVAVLAVSLACGGKRKHDDAPAAESAAAAATPAPSASAKPPHPARADDLIKEYAANEVRADEKYKGKRFVVIGVVKEIKKSFANEIYLVVTGTHAGPFDLQAVQAFFDDDSLAAASKLDKGKVVAIDCKIEGLLLTNVVARDCRFFQLPPDAPSAAASEPASSAPAASSPRKPKH